jgi:hypothetical protein
MTWIVATENALGEDIVLKISDKYEEAIDYLEQCERASLRFSAREPTAKVTKFKLYEVA